MNSKLDKIANPLNFYKNPIDVDKDKELTIGEKIKVLQNWLDDINLRQIAEAENMPSYHPSRYHMAEIEQLLRQYQNKA
ncbi:hypothetical protein E3983_06350 [Legionella israelensis]|nr:hypothetical protein [Legionella israelensis]QBR84005.1 hypothetical protein E3983_06350 [Legionella israelensis]QBS10891.1 hypothetical protein E4T55_14215 [Legionella israelensis]QDP72898.1 hypothetical protein FOG18_10160 [Legionella israelensis]